MVVRRRTFYEAYGFDERYMFYCEDDDFGIKARQAGWKIMFTPNASGIHEEHQSTHGNPSIYNHMKESCKMFGEKWSWYLEKNKFIVPGEF
jgi:GT2 family glycosyltransferase